MATWQLQFQVLWSGKSVLQLFYIHTGCYSAEEGDVRLRNGAVSAGADAEYGRLEIFHSGGWGTVCDTHFAERTSRNPSFTRGAEDVACKQLGYKQGFQIPSLVSIRVHSRPIIGAAQGHCSLLQMRHLVCGTRSPHIHDHQGHVMIGGSKSVSTLQAALSTAHFHCGLRTAFHDELLQLVCKTASSKELSGVGGRG